MVTCAFRGLRRAICSLLAAAAVLFQLNHPQLHAADEIRALWVVRTTLTSPSAIDRMVKAARAGGFNTLLVQVRGRADAYYSDGLEPRPVTLTEQPSFDPLAVTIERAHQAGLSVHAWVNVNLVAGAGELPPSREHIIYRHPEWLMVPRTLAASLAGTDPTSPQYLGRLSRYARSQPDQVEGLYLSPATTGAADYTVGILRDIVRRYAVDGVHLDYARYPNEEFDYSRETLGAFRRLIVGELSPTTQRGYEARLAAEPLIYTQAFPERFRAFRTEQLTALIGRLRDTIKSLRPTAIVSAAVGPDHEEAARRRFQDWRLWLERDLVDVVCPMAYTADAGVFATQVAAARQIAGSHPIWAGIGAYQLSSSEIVANVQAARRLGVGGIILFSYDSLTGPTRGPEYLTEVGRALFMQ